MFALALQERLIWKPMPGNMVRRESIPAAMLNRNARIRSEGLKADLDESVLARRKARLAPSKSELLARRPHADAPHLELSPVLKPREQPPAFTQFKA